ncbi:hypothetical protein RB195_023632 [Necator americanus]|uniref:Uncharacterized protein n=1 Tax=Necator americanus TaxID=51031 RepID=A0ABR1EK57_NECAM
MRRICTKKRLSVMNADQQKFQFRGELLTLHVKCEKDVSLLNVRRKSVHVYVQVTRARRQVLLREISEILHIIVDPLFAHQEGEDCSCETICDAHLPSLVELTAVLWRAVMRSEAKRGGIAHCDD